VIILGERETDYNNRLITLRKEWYESKIWD
jgi:hypothetical protein